MSEATAAPHRVVLHVGAPKSGTTYLQETLWHNHAALKEAGFLCPGRRQRDMFLAAVELRGSHQTWGLTEEQVSGTWQRLCRAAREFPGTTIMSHELLAAASRAQVRAALAELEGLEVHVVFTARDLGRQAMSEWQERIKNGAVKPFDTFRHGLVQHVERNQLNFPFWRNQNMCAALSKWGDGLPPENLHVVVAPPPGGPRDALWTLFAEACGFDTAGLDPNPPAGGANQTLGLAQIALLRRVNQVLAGRIRQPWYARVVKRTFAQGLLPQYPSARPVCPPDLAEALGQVSRRWIRIIRKRGYVVHGDLRDLVPPTASVEAPDPDAVVPEEQATLSAQVIADLLVELMEREKAEAEAQRGPAPGSGAPRRGGLRRRAGRLVRRLARR